MHTNPDPLSGGGMYSFRLKYSVLKNVVLLQKPNFWLGRCDSSLGTVRELIWETFYFARENAVVHCGNIGNVMAHFGGLDGSWW